MSLRTIIFGLLTFVALNGCQLFDNGQNELIKEYNSPKQDFKVIVFEKKGNATTNNSIQASIQGVDYKLKNKDVGNIFVADKFEGLGTKDSILTIVWTDDKTIEILYPKDIRTFKLEKQFKTGKDNLKIDYKMTTEKTHIKK